MPGIRGKVNLKSLKYGKGKERKQLAALGHILLASVIFHPETAGGGLEYAWGKLKYEQRHIKKDDAKLIGGLVFIKKKKENSVQFYLYQESGSFSKFLVDFLVPCYIVSQNFKINV